MKLAVLPFNVAEGPSPALGRQIANFAADLARSSTGGEINAVSYLAQAQDDDGVTRSSFINVSETLLDRQWLAQMFGQRWPILVPPGPEWADAHWRWGGGLGLGLLVMVWQLRDPASRPLRRSLRW